MPSTGQRSKNDAGELGWRCSTSSTMVLSPSAPATCQNTRQHKEQHLWLWHPILQDMIQTDVLPQDHTRLEQTAPGDCDSWVSGLLQVQAEITPVNTNSKSPPPPPPPASPPLSTKYYNNDPNLRNLLSSNRIINKMMLATSWKKKKSHQESAWEATHARNDGQL